MSGRIERRSFLKTAAAGIVAGTSGGEGVLAAPAPTAPAPAAPAIAQDRIEWRMVSAWPRGLPGVGTGAERLARAITAMSGGRLTVTYYAGGELAPALGCFDAVARGEAELGHDTSNYQIDRIPAAAVLSTLPWGLIAGELSGWIHHGGGQALWDELYAPYGVRAVLAGNTGTQMFGWFRKEINSLDDIKGLRYRTVGNHARIMARLGAVPVFLPGGEILPALRDGRLDAAEWIGPYNDLELGFHQVARYYYSPGFHEPAAGVELIINRAGFEALPEDLQQIVLAAARAANDDIYTEYVAKSGPALATLVNQHKVQLRSLSREILIAMGAAANEILLEIMDRDGISRRLVESYLSYRAAVVPWTRVGEQAYLNARLLPFAHGARR